MIVVTSDVIAGKRIIKVLGLVKGNTVRARNFTRDIIAGFRNFIGGEIFEYTDMITDSRDQAIGRMIEAAEKMGANAIVAQRFTTSAIMQNAAELLAYGTAVVVEDE